MNVDVIIPALNEAASIPHVLADIPNWVRQVIVVDNGSSDGTAEAAAAGGAMEVHENRRGYGYACLAGIAALEKPDIVVFLDGDYSDDPSEMHQLVAPILTDQADLVIGSRLTGNLQPGSMLWHARSGNWLLSRIISRLTGCHVTDIGPFRAIRWECLQSLRMGEGCYGWTIEMILKTCRLGYRIMEIPVTYRPRIGVSKISGSPIASINAAVVMFASIVRYTWLPLK